MGAKSARILIVEDEAVVARDLRQALAEQGFEPISVAASAEEAFEQASDQRPDVVLMDIRIQGVTDGIAAARALHERFGSRIIFLTAPADEPALRRAHRTRPSGYLLKPVLSTQLKMSVELALHQQGWRGSSEEPELGRERTRAGERAEALLRMASGLAHQINNPLTVVLSNAELVARELQRQGEAAAPVSHSGERQRLEEAREAHAELRVAAERIARIVANIQSFSEPAPEPSACAHVHLALHRALHRLEPQLGSRARVTLQLDPVPLVATSEGRLVELFQQLLLNAAQATPAALAEANEIIVRTRLLEGGQVRIEVCDTGCGMPPEVQARAFEPFFTTRPAGAGTGLGLSICHAIVTAAGGQVQVESRERGGTRVSVVLPSAPRSSGMLAAPAGPARASNGARLRGAGRLRSTRARRILVVDDEPLLLRSVRRLLPEYELVCVERAKDALSLLDAGTVFDLIVSDLMMPEMSGIDFYEALQARYPEDARRVIFVTGAALGGHAGAFLGSVPNARLEKPFAAADLRRVIAQALA